MIIKDITLENFYRYKKSKICLQDFSGITIIDGENGCGKCVHPDTHVTVTYSNPLVKEKLKKLNKKEIEKHLHNYDVYEVTVKNIVDLYQKHPEAIGLVLVNTPYGKKKILAAEQTAFSSTLEIKTSEGNLICHPKHRLKKKNKLKKTSGVFIEAQECRVGDQLQTENGPAKISSIESCPKKIALYDFQVEDVEQYYTNGIVSHNSSIVESVEWVLYGVSQRYGKSCDDVIGPFKKWAGVEVLLLDEEKNETTTIKRYRKHPEFGNGVIIDISGNQITDTDSVNIHAQKKIDTLLGMDHASFKSACIAHQNAFNSFASATDKEKKAIMQKMMGLEQIPKALEYVKEKVSELKEQEIEHKRKSSSLESTVESLQSNLTMLSNSHKETEKTLKQSISQASADISEYRENLEEAEETIESYEESIKKITLDKAAVEKDIQKKEEIESENLKELLAELETANKKLQDFCITVNPALLEEKKEKEAELQNIKTNGKAILKEHSTQVRILKGSIADLQEEENRTSKKIISAVSKKDSLQEQIKECQSEAQNLVFLVGIPCDKCGVPMTEDGIKKSMDSLGKKIEKYQSESFELENSIQNWESKKKNLLEKVNQETEKLHQCEKDAPEIDAEQATKNLEQVLGKIDLESSKIEVERQKLKTSVFEHESRVSKLTADSEKDKSKLISSKNNLEAEESKLKALKTQTEQNCESLREKASKGVARLKELKVQKKELVEKQAKEKKELTEEIKIQGTHLSELFEKQEKLSTELKHYTWWVDGFGDRGLKSHIMETYVPELNRVVKKFNQIMTSGQFNIKFSATTTLKSGKSSEKFDVQVVNKKGACKFKGNSGGEQMRANLAVFMTLQVVGLKGKFQQIFLDECVKDLDPAGVEKYFQLLKHMRDSENISSFIITHDEKAKGLCDNQITVSKAENKQGEIYSVIG